MNALKNISWLLLTILIYLALTGCTQQNQNHELESLHQQSNFEIGTAVSVKRIKTDSAWKRILLKDFNSLTAENDMKMYNIVNSDGSYNWDDVDYLIDFAEKNNFRVHGHTLVWHQSVPKWLKERRSDTVFVEDFLRNYINDYVGRYKGRIKSWDVVNEVINDQTGEYRSSFWYDLLGKNLMELAFRAAHEADPNALLFYNDYRIERDSIKLEATLQMISELLKKGVPIHGIGLQMHTNLKVSNDVIAKSIKKCASTGLQIHLSELDVITHDHDESKRKVKQENRVFTPELAELQREKYSDLIRIYKENVPKKQRYGITLWGFTDRYTWIRPFFGLQDWPLLYDDDYRVKPAYYGLMEGLRKDIP